MSSSSATSAPWPVSLRLAASRHNLRVEFDDGVTYELAAELLRVESPSAEVQGHHPAQKQQVVGKEHVTILAVEPVGNYAVRLMFDDGHETGIYTWAYLYSLGTHSAA